MRRLLALAIACTLLAACASTGGEKPLASPADANALAAGRSLAHTPLSDAAWPASDWWKRYGDDQLDALVDEALEGSPTLRAADARVRKALAAAGIANSARKLQLSGTADVSRQRFSENYIFPPPFGGSWNTPADLDANFDFDLDLFGRLRSAYEGALDEAHAAQVDRQGARLLLSTSIVRAYVQLQGAYDQLDVATAQLADRDNLVKLVEQRKAVGLDSDVELRQAQAGIPEAQERIAQLDETIDLTRHQIAALLGEGPDRGLAIARPRMKAFGGPALPSHVPADLIGRRPDIVAERWRIEAARRDIDSAKAEFYPDVNIAALVGLQSLSVSDLLRAGSLNVNVGPALRLPIFDGGRLRANLAGKDADYDIAVEQYNQGLADALREVADQLVSMRSIDRQRAQAADGVRLAQDGYDLAMLRYREGLGNYLQVLVAETQVLAQKNLQATLDARELDASVSLTRALGGGYETD
ncbi:MAG TPA: efflux transporter outer membrane subunit [Usitatibacter sp.]|nr:efflux transporter outer membrane subunit [Usitatibacter sp.]